MEKSVLAPALVVLTSLVAAAVQAAAPLTPLDAFVVAHGYGGAQFVSIENTYRVPINANGKVGDLTIDTGASGSVVFRPSVRKFGLFPTETTHLVHGAFGKGKEKVSIVTIHQLTMGNLTLMNVRVGVVSDWLSGGLYRPYGLSDGLLGLSEMLRYGMVLDLNNRLILAHPGGRMTGISDGIRSMLTKEGYVAIPLSIVDDHLQVSAVVNTTRCKLIVDTGSFLTMLDRKFARGARVGGYDTGLTAHGLGVSGRGMGYTHFDELRIGDLTIKSASATVSDLDASLTGGKSNAAGLLGAEYLGLHGAIFDFNSNTLYLRPQKKT